MKVIFLGPPGVGKGTQAKVFCESQGILHISTGEMLRASIASGSTIGQRMKEIIDAGHLIPDDLMVELIKERVQKDDCAQGYVLDGFPRTLAQAEALERMFKTRGEVLSHAILFDLSEEEVLSRLAFRRNAESRSDDTEETQQERLRVYKEQTEPLIEFYQRSNLLLTVDAHGDVDEVQRRVLEELKKAQ